MTTGSSKEARDRLPHNNASGQGQCQGVPGVGELEGTKPYRLNELAERIRQALKVEKRVNPAAGFTHEG